MSKPKQAREARTVARAAVLAAGLVTAGVVSAVPSVAHADSQSQLPFRCFAQTGTDHVVFGPVKLMLNQRLMLDQGNSINLILLFACVLGKLLPVQHVS